MFKINQKVNVTLIDSDGHCDYGIGTIVKIMPECVRYKYLIKFDDDFQMLFKEEEIFVDDAN